jgi:hypothetical protein
MITRWGADSAGSSQMSDDEEGFTVATPTSVDAPVLAQAAG